jgi:uncharacterized protein (TIGR02266 family)
MDEMPANDAHDQVEIQVDQTSEHNFWSGLEMNMAEGGVFVATHRPLEVGACVRVEMRLPFDQEPVVASGTVLWTRPHSEENDLPAGVGVQFVDIAEAAIAKVRHFTENVREPLFYAA